MRMHPTVSDEARRGREGEARVKSGKEKHEALIGNRRDETRLTCKKAHPSKVWRIRASPYHLYHLTSYYPSSSLPSLLLTSPPPPPTSLLFDLLTTLPTKKSQSEHTHTLTLKLRTTYITTCVTHAYETRLSSQVSMSYLLFVC